MEEFGNVGRYRCRCGDPENYQNALILFHFNFQSRKFWPPHAVRYITGRGSGKGSGGLGETFEEKIIHLTRNRKCANHPLRMGGVCCHDGKIEFLVGVRQ